jgi:RHS repeat-associated protein
MTRWILALVAALVLVTGCKEEPAPAETPPKDSTAAALTSATPPAEDVCAPVLPFSLAPGWTAGPVVATAGAPGSLPFNAAAGERALLVLQNGDGLGGGEASQVVARLNGAEVGRLASGTRLVAVPLTLGTSNTLEVSVVGGGSVRASVAPLASLPCTLVDVSVSRGSGKPAATQRPFARPDAAALGVLLIEAGELAVGQVQLNGITVAEWEEGSKDTKLMAYAVALRADNVVSVLPRGKPGSTLRVRVFDADTLAPPVQITQPAADTTSAISPLSVQGQTGADARAVDVSGVQATLTAGQFSASVPLTPGPQAVVAAARDFCGNVARQCRRITHATAPPEVTVTGVTHGHSTKGPVKLEWTVEDPTQGSVVATLNGASVTSGKTVSDEGPYELVVTATNAGGLSTTVSVSFFIDHTPPALVLELPAANTYTQASSVEVVAQVTDNGPLGQVSVGGVALLLGSDGKYRGQVQLLEGNNLLQAVAFDAAGNKSTVERTVVHDATPPQLVVESPLAEAKSTTGSVEVKGVVTDTAPLTLTLNGQPVAVGAGGAFSQTVVLQQLATPLEVRAEDSAGNTATVSRTVRYNTTPPAVTVTEPSTGLVTTATQVTVKGTALPADATDSVTVKVVGTVVPVDADGQFSRTVSLPLGTSILDVRAEDGYGLVRTVRLQVTRKSVTVPPDAGTGTPDAGTDTPDAGTDTPDAGIPSADAGQPGPGSDAGTPPTDPGGVDAGPPPPAPTVVVTAPEEDAVLGASTIAVTGTVQEGAPPFQVTVGGVQATMSGRSFAVGLALEAGPRTLQVVAKDALGRTASVERAVVVDRTPPFLDITHPETNPATVNQSPYLLEGEVGDTHLVGVTVQGRSALVLGGHFSLPVALSEGTNAIEVVATDKAGNFSRVVQQLVVEGAPPTVTILEPLNGSEASGPIIPVRAKVHAFAPLTEVRIGTGLAEEKPGGVFVANVPLGLGLNTLRVTATDANGLKGSASVTVRYRDPSKEALAVTGVDPSPSESGVEPDALISVAFNKAIETQDLTQRFTVKRDGVTLPGGYSVAPGGQTATFIARDPLPEGARLSVEVSGVQAQVPPHQGSIFKSEFVVRRPLTRVRGVVVDDDLLPVPGVRVTLEGTGLSTRTAADGNWALMGGEGGDFVVRYEGGQTSTGKPLPTVRRRLFVRAEEETVDAPLVLTPVDTLATARLEGLGTAVADFSIRHAGLSFEVPADGFTFESGATSGVVTATRLQPHLLPLSLDGRTTPTALWQLGPAGVRFHAPVEVEFPNTTELPPGRWVVLLAMDPQRFLIQRAGFGRVSADGTRIRSAEPLEVGSLEFFGYAGLSQELHEAVAPLLEANTPDGGSAVDGGLGMLRPVPPRREPPLWELMLAPFTVGEAHASALLGLFPAYNALDTLIANSVPASVSGVVRAPRERKLVLELMDPPPSFFAEAHPVERGHPLPITFRVTEEMGLGVTEESQALFSAQLSAVRSDGGVMAPPSAQSWQNEGEGSTQLSTVVELSEGATFITLSGSAEAYNLSRQLQLVADLLPSPDAGLLPDGGATSYLLHLTQPGSDGGVLDEPFQSVVRFEGLGVSVTGPSSGGRGVTGTRGTYTIPVMAWPGEMGISCTQVPLGPRPVFTMSADGGGVTEVQLVETDFHACSPTYSLYPGRNTSGADILLDVRMLYGTVTLVDRQGAPIPLTCEDDEPTQWSEDGGTLSLVSKQDVATTEVHFFRADNLERPIAQFTLALPDPACMAGDEPEEQPLDDGGVLMPSHASYARMRAGPTVPFKRVIRDRCLAIEQKHGGPLSLDGGPQSEEERFYVTECQDNRVNFLRLSPGDQLVVFAVNHATGHAGMKQVSVPPINRFTSPDGGCPEDDAAGGPLEVTEGTVKMYVSRCTQQSLGILANLALYPPELDVRISRRAEEGGLRRDPLPSLVRYGGAATTRDDFVHVSTHWRVRTAAEPQDAGSDGGMDAGSDAGAPDAGDGGSASCMRGRLPDGGLMDGGIWDGGGICEPYILHDVDTQKGLPLEVYCSQLHALSPPDQRAVCLRDDTLLADVPKGVPPISGRIVRVVGSAAEEPAVIKFDVQPGLTSSALEPAMRTRTASGEVLLLENLPRANYYLHVVGHPAYTRDVNRNGVIEPTERNLPPAKFDSNPQVDPPGRPTQALSLKNVYNSIESNGVRVPRYDRAREHEFRVIDLGTPRIEARADGELPRDLGSTKEPAAREEDLSYRFLTTLLEPEEAGRANTGLTEYVLRLGGDEFGMECSLDIDATTHALVGECEGEYLMDVLSATDVLYLELYLKGNAENVLYRFNFHGLSRRKDFITAGSQYTGERSVEAQDNGKPVQDRPISQAALASFFVQPDELRTGIIRLCTDAECKPGTLIKAARLELKPDDSYEVTDLEEEPSVSDANLIQLDKPGFNRARHFRFPLPATVAKMPGSGRKGDIIYLALEPEQPALARRVRRLGRPQGGFEGVNARAPGQQTTQGVNVADGHLSFTHEDFSVPQLAETVRFARTYNNQNNTLTPLGIGWNHSYDGWVTEEELGRYAVVLLGQGYSFPSCEQLDSEKGTASGCKTDKSHGLSLEVVKPKAESDQKIVRVTGPEGSVYEFEQYAYKSDTVGRRRWLLTRFHHGHARKVNNEDLGWTTLKYVKDSNLLDKVERKPGKLFLEFKYEQLDTASETVTARMKHLARTENFARLRHVLLKRKQDGVVLHDVEFKQSPVGNLELVTRATGAPYESETPIKQEWVYTYYDPKTDASGQQAWLSANELKTAALELNDLRQWHVEYGRGATGSYGHVDPLESVSSVMGTGLPGAGVTFSSPEQGRRTITRPDGVQVDVKLNDYGSSTEQKTGTLQASSMVWPRTEDRAGKVAFSSIVSSAGYGVGQDTDDKLRAKGLQWKGAPSVARDIAGLSEDAFLWKVEERGSLDRVIRQSFLTDSGSATLSTPRNDKGELTGLTLKGADGKSILSLSQTPDEDGRVLSQVDAQGNAVTYQGFDGQLLGLPTSVQVVAPTPKHPGKGKGLERYTRTLDYDDYGRLILDRNETTGAETTWAYDSLGRLRKRTRKGQPDQEWTYSYTLGADRVTVREELKNAGRVGQTFWREVFVKDGFKEWEKFSYGQGKVAERSFTYTNGRLSTETEKLTPQRTVTRTYTYDANGRLESVKAGDTVVSEVTLDADGRVLTSTDENGLTTVHRYDKLGREAEREYGPGDIERFERDATGAVVRHSFGSLPTKHALKMTNDAAGRPLETRSEESSVGGLRRSVTYDGAGRVAREEDHETGLVEELSYDDALGRPTYRVRTVQGSLAGQGSLKLEETRSYTDTPGKTLVEVVRTIQSATGTRTEKETLTLDVLGRLRFLKETVDGTETLRESTYDAAGNPLSELDGLNRKTQYEYDEAGYRTAIVQPGGIRTEFTTDAAGRVLTQTGPHTAEQWIFQYDDLGRRTETTLRHLLDGTIPPATWKTDFLAPGHVKGHIQETDPDGYLTYKTLNTRGLVVREERVARRDSGGDPDEANKAPRITTNEYDGPWLKYSKVEEGSWVLEVKRNVDKAIDDQGRVLREVEAWQKGGDFYRYTTTTDWLGRTATVHRTSETNSVGQSAQRSMTMVMDSLGNLVRRVEGTLTDQWQYDAAGLVTWELPSGIEMPTTYTYAQGLLKQKTFGPEVTQYSYFPDRQLATMTLPSSLTDPSRGGYQKTYTYNARGLLERETFGRGDEISATKYFYDAGGFLSKTIQGDGLAQPAEWTFVHGPRGELREVKQPGVSEPFKYAYDGRLNLKSVTPPAGSVTVPETFSHDFLGRMKRRTRGTLATWVTDWNEGVATTKDPNGDIAVQVLDGRGQLARVTYQPGPTSAPLTKLTGVAYEYSFDGQLELASESRTEGTVKNDWLYDASGRLQSLTRGTETVSFGYKPFTRLQETVVVPNRWTVSSTYDGLGRLLRRVGQPGLTLDVAWEPGGERLASITDTESGVTELYCYNGRGLLKSVTGASGAFTCDAPAANPYSHYSYTYDSRGNRKTETFLKGGDEPELTEYAYDGADRLTGVRSPDASAVVYSLAPDGSRKGEKTVFAFSGDLSQTSFEQIPNPDKHRVYEYDPTLGALTSIKDRLNGDQLVASYSRDNAGRVTGIVEGPRTRTLRWDAADRLVQVDGAASSSIHYTYDYAGLRRSRSLDDSVTRYLWAGGELLEEQLPSASPRPLQRVGRSVAAEGTDRLLRDGLGSAVARLEADGLVKSYRFDAWGAYSGPAPGPSEPSLGYTGHAYDADSGLVYAQQRWLDTGTGRFLSEDPVGAAAYLNTPQGLNPWLYANANPMRYTDPDGRCADFDDLSGNVLCWKGLLNGDLSGYTAYKDARTEYRLEQAKEALVGAGNLVVEFVKDPSQPIMDAAVGTVLTIYNKGVCIKAAAEKDSLGDAAGCVSRVGGALMMQAGTLLDIVTDRGAPSVYQGRALSDSKVEVEKGVGEVLEIAGGIKALAELPVPKMSLPKMPSSGGLKRFLPEPQVPQLAPAGGPVGLLDNVAEEGMSAARPMKMSAAGEGASVSSGPPPASNDSLIKPLGRGTTANNKDRWLPRNLREQLAIDEAMQKPTAGEIAAGPLGDGRWDAEDGWVKMQQTIDPGGRGGPISIHYNYNTVTTDVDDFKVVLRKPYVPPKDPPVPPTGPVPP